MNFGVKIFFAFRILVFSNLEVSNLEVFEFWGFVILKVSNPNPLARARQTLKSTKT